MVVLLVHLVELLIQLMILFVLFVLQGAGRRAADTLASAISSLLFFCWCCWQLAGGENLLLSRFRELMIDHTYSSSMCCAAL